MGKLVRYQDDESGCFSRVDWENGEPAFISIAQKGVLVKRSRIGLFGANLYVEQNIHECVDMSRILDERFLKEGSLISLPIELTSPVLQSLTRLALETHSATEFCVVIGEARQLIRQGL